MIATPNGRLIDGADAPSYTYNQDGLVTFETMTAAVADFGKTVFTVPYSDTIIDPLCNKEWHEAKDDTPKEFHPLLCTRCGGSLAFKNNFLVCEYCGTMYSSDLSISEKPQECYEPENKCVTCGHSINATTMDDSEPVYICGSMNGCTYEEE